MLTLRRHEGEEHVADRGPLVVFLFVREDASRLAGRPQDKMAKKRTGRQKKATASPRPAPAPRQPVIRARTDAAAGRKRSLISRLFEPVDIASLVVFRICFGVILFIEACRYLYSNWVGPYWVLPEFNFTFLLFDWVRPWPGDGMYLHFLALGLLALCIAAGFFYRLATILFFPAFGYILLLDKTYYLNHFYLITILSFLLILVPAHRAFSIDAWRNPKLRANTVPAWTVWSLALQIAIPYFYGGIAKLKTDWLIRGEPMRTFLATAADGPLLESIFTAEPVVYFFAWGGTVFDLAIPFLLWWPRTRAIAFLAALGFHLTNAFLFHIGIFPWFMICASTLFFSPGWPRQFGFPPPWADEQAGMDRARREEADAAPGGDWMSRPWTQQLAVGVLAVHFVGQLIVPLHHYLYPGDVNWNREGSYFTWHMRIATMNTRGTIVAKDPATGESWEVNPRQHLNDRQARKMFADPDMVLQYAHFVARDAAANGRGEIEVRAKVHCALNHRPSRVVIDPDANLVAHERTIWPASFIIPLDQAPLVEDEDKAAASRGSRARDLRAAE